MLDKIIRRSDVIDKEALCIQSGQRVSVEIYTYCVHRIESHQVWNLRLTIHFLADSGNMLDCACLAAIVALKHFRRPEVEVVGDQVIVVGVLPRECLRISPNSLTASTNRTSTNASLDAPHDILFHLCLFPRRIHTSDSRSQSARTTTECWDNVDRAQRSARAMCRAKGWRGTASPW